MRVATLTAGYADGYPRLLSNQGVVSIHGKPAPVLGRVCMDQMVVDVTDIPEAHMGDEAVLLGGEGGDSFFDAAQKTGTINYELVCGVVIAIKLTANIRDGLVRRPNRRTRPLDKLRKERTNNNKR